MNTSKMLKYYSRAAKTNSIKARKQFLFIASYYEWRQARDILSQANRGAGGISRRDAMRWLNRCSKRMRERYSALKGV